MRDQVHKQIFTNASCVFMLYKNDQVLLHLRDDKAPTNPNTWALFGGGIEEDETSIECVKREAKEELNYTLTNPQLLLITKQVHTVFTHEHVYYQEYDGSKLTLCEGADMKWYDKNNLPENMRDAQRNLVNHLFTYLDDKHA